MTNPTNQTNNNENEKSSPPNTQTNIKIGNKEHETEYEKDHTNNKNNGIEEIIKIDTVFPLIENFN